MARVSSFLSLCLLLMAMLAGTAHGQANPARRNTDTAMMGAHAPAPSPLGGDIVEELATEQPSNQMIAERIRARAPSAMRLRPRRYIGRHAPAPMRMIRRPMPRDVPMRDMPRMGEMPMGTKPESEEPK